MRPTLSPSVVLLGLTLVAWTAGGAQDNLTIIGGSGGTAFSRSCGAGSILTGIRARVGITVDAIGIRCRPIRADGTLGAESDVGNVWGGGGGTAFAKSCGSNTVIGAQVAKFNSIMITDLTYHCFRWTPSTRRWDPNHRGVAIYVVPSGGAPGLSLGAGTMTQCPATARPGDGVRGRSGMVIDAVGLVCNTP